MNIRRFENASVMAHEAAALLTHHLGTASPTPFAVMLAGGRTPLPAYQLLLQQKFAVSPTAHILLSDDRMVPPTSPESNFAGLSRVIAALHIPDKQVFRVKTELDITKAADDYNKTLSDFLSKGGRIPFGLLGLGADGHTASLFSLADVQRGRGRYAMAVPRTGGPSRVTVTADLLARVGSIVFLVSGPDKRDIIQTFSRAPETVTAGMAVARCLNVQLWVC